MSKYSNKEKLEAVIRVIEKGVSPEESGKILGADKKAVCGWVERYKRFGSEGLIMKKGSYSGNYKVSVIEYMHEKKLSLFQAAVHFGIPSDSTVLKWERIYYEEGPAGLFKDRRGRPREMSKNKRKKPNLKKKLKKI